MEMFKTAFKVVGGLATIALIIYIGAHSAADSIDYVDVLNSFEEITKKK